MVLSSNLRERAEVVQYPVTGVLKKKGAETALSHPWSSGEMVSRNYDTVVFQVQFLVGPRKGSVMAKALDLQ